jgi:PKD domain/Bacterial Ig domain
MGLCHNCGNPMEAGLPFCSECGTAAPRVPEAAPPPVPGPSQLDSVAGTGPPPLPAHDDLAETEQNATPKSRKLPLIPVGVGALVLVAAVLLFVLNPFANKAPVLSGIEASQLIVHSGDSITLTARATDPNEDKLIYKWTVSAGQIVGDGPSVTLSTANVDAGSGRTDISVNVTVSDERGGDVSGHQTITVTPATISDATATNSDGALAVTLEADQRSVRAGEAVSLTVNVSNRDPNEVAYEWRSTGGTLRGGGRSAVLEASGLQLSGGETQQLIVTIKVTDSAGTVASDSLTIAVAATAPPNWPPTVSLTASKTSVQQGEEVEISANASDRDGDRLTYSWNVTGGQLIGIVGSRVTLRTSGARPGVVEVSATVSDQRGASATDRLRIAVNPRANHSPAVFSVEPDRTRVRVGETVSVTARASDPDNDELRYSWTSSAGTIRGSGSTIALDTSGIEPGSSSRQVRLTVTVNDQGGATASGSALVTVIGEGRGLEPARRNALPSGYQAMEGDDLIVTLNGAPGAIDASGGLIDVTAGGAGTVQLSGVWPSGACRVNAGSRQNVDRISIVQPPLPSNGYSKIIVRVRPKNSKQPVKFTISWRAL